MRPRRAGALWPGTPAATPPTGAAAPARCRPSRLRPRRGGAARVRRFAAESREQRRRIGLEGRRRFGRRLGWGVSIGGERTLFTTLSLPVMTRLKLPERQVLDTLVQAGVARSRSDALAWC